MKSPQYSEIRCSSDPSLIRYEKLEGREHLIIPVVMLVGNTVIQAANAPTPELVPLDCLIRSHIKGFDSHPVTPYHPKTNGKFVSASSPEKFEEARIGTIFNTHLNSPNLGCEAWIDIDRAKELGGDAQLALEKLQAGEVIDISVGVYHDSIVVNGKTSDGKEYGAIWTEIYGDHLALLPAGQGACNQELGCGAPRVAELAESAQSNTGEEISPMENNNSNSGVNSKQEPTSFLSRLLAKFRASVIFDDGDSDEDLHKMLSREMRVIDPAFDWICYVYREASSFIYATYIIMGGNYQGQMKWWRRTFTLSPDGKSVTINNDAVEVRLKEMWETVEDPEEVEEIMATEIRSNCSCSQIAQATNNEEEIEENVMADQINPNPTNPNPVAAQDAPVAAPVAAPASVVAPVTPPATAPPQAPVLTVQQAIAACPDLAPLIDMGKRFQALEDARKADLVTRLSTSQTVYDLASLQSKPLDELEKIATLVGIDTPKVDYSARGLQTPTVASAPTIRELPDPWGLEAKGIRLN